MEDVTVNNIDDQSRKLSDYKSTNMPLSASEIRQDEDKDTAHEGWAPRTTENIGDMTPLPERPAIP
jgi:hypothetical protein